MLVRLPNTLDSQHEIAERFFYRRIVDRQSCNGGGRYKWLASMPTTKEALKAAPEFKYPN